jgi:hypothetical protein
MELSVQLHAPAVYPQGKSAWYSSDRRLGGPQSQSGCFGEEKNSQCIPGLEHSIIQPIAQCYATELSRLLLQHMVLLKMFEICKDRNFDTPCIQNSSRGF